MIWNFDDWWVTGDWWRCELCIRGASVVDIIPVVVGSIAVGRGVLTWLAVLMSYPPPQPSSKYPFWHRMASLVSQLIEFCDNLHERHFVLVQSNSKRYFVLLVPVGWWWTRGHWLVVVMVMVVLVLVLVLVVVGGADGGGAAAGIGWWWTEEYWLVRLNPEKWGDTGNEAGSTTLSGSTLGKVKK